MTALPRFMIAAAHKSSGKTVLSSGIARALHNRGLAVGTFKKGPDYIDPMWLSLATDRPAYNLDFNAMSHDELRALFGRKAPETDISLVEANKGLFDGVSTCGCDSNAALAKLLGLPVVLVVNTRGMTRGIAPLLMGYTAFDADVRIDGVILNMTGGTRHEMKLRQAVETYTDIPVLGALGADADMDISERHLGLVTPGELFGTRAFLDGVAERIEASVDLDRVIETARSARDYVAASVPVTSTTAKLKIGIARDAAFSFYYGDDLEAFEAMGATLVPIDMTRDTDLPEIDGLFIGGGFPETQAQALAANAPMRTSLRDALNGGLPCYAECGGLMYLTNSITYQGETYPMVGFFDADTVMHARPQGRGYTHFTMTEHGLWPVRPGEMRAHEFHYASLENLKNPVFARRVTRGFGTDGRHDALVRANTQAGFIHLRHAEATPWVSDFLSFVAAHKARKSPARSARGLEQS